MRHEAPVLPHLESHSHNTPVGEISCPGCGEIISLSEALLTQLTSKFEKEFKKKEQAALGLIRQKEELLARKGLELQKELTDKLVLQKAELEKKIRGEFSKAKDVELEDLKNQVVEKDKRLGDALQTELDLRKKARELEEKEKAFELELLKKVEGEKSKLEGEIAKRLHEEQRLKMAEKDKQLEGMRTTIEELKRKSEITSQQLQGEVLELELESLLKKFCLTDDIEPVAKGARGGDIIHRVVSNSGQHVGTIVWETKRTKAWSDGWVDKIKEDQRAISAECAVIVSDVLPKGVLSLSYYEGVWVCDSKTALGLASALRLCLLQVSLAKVSVAGKDAKMEVMYKYLTGTQFTQSIQAVVESFKEMQASILVEKKAYLKIWAQREQQLEKMILNTASVYGSVQGIVGGALPRIEALELPQGNRGED